MIYLAKPNRPGLWLAIFFVWGWVAVGLNSSMVGPSVAKEPIAKETITPVELRCEHMRDPEGIDELIPRFSWMIEGTGRNQRQSAYRILVASDLKALARNSGDVWDSGQVASDQSHLVSYAGKKLVAGKQYFWKVKVWDGVGDSSDWSTQATWSMGLLKPEDWKGAKWIGRDDEDADGISIADIKQSQWLWYPEGNASHDAPVATRYFRRALDLPSQHELRRAVCFFAGDDQCVFYVNGVQIGVGRGHPGLVGVDIASMLHAGENHLAVAATNMQADVPNNPGGWIGAVRLEFENGEAVVILSDKSWMASKAVETGWEQGNYDGVSWLPAMELGKAGMAPWGIPWKEKWFSEHRRLAARYLRREFQLPQGPSIRKATAHVSGLGFFELFANGKRVGDSLMQPALTGYDKRVMVVAMDVTDKLKEGANALGIVLSNGRFFAPRVQVPMPMHSYGYPKLLMRLQVEYSDGSEYSLTSDASWRLTCEGPVLASNEFDGEEYDARLEMKGWAAPGFVDSNWQPAAVVSPPNGALESQMMEPIRVIQKLEPVQLIQAKPGVWMVDFGQAFYGVVQMRVSGKAGTRVSMRTSFNVLDDGTLNFINDRSALNTDVYTLRGEGLETWHPRFRGNATRWVQIEGYPGTPTPADFVGLVTHTDHATVGRFSCSNELINRIYRNAVWGTRMQNRSVPMEPDRDERMPWSGHPAKTSESEGWVFNVARFYEHFLHNYRVHQADDGSLQEILPPYWEFNSKDIIWPSVASIIPDWYYHFYGDSRPLRDNYEMMKRFVLYHEKTNLKSDGTMDHCIYGDWVDAESMGSNSRNFGATSRPLMGTAYFYHNCRIVQRAAELLGHADDAKYFEALSKRVRAAFLQRFFDATTGRFESATQCSYVLPLAFGLVPDEHRDTVIHNLVDDIMVQRRGHTSVGLVGMQWLMQVLTEIGHPEVAYSIATRTERPSWGYMLGKGATTIWERWDLDTQDGGMNGESQKILSGNFEAWCYQTLGGINYDPSDPGFKHVVLRPRRVGDLEWVKCNHIGPYGDIRSDWQVDGERWVWHVEVPVNTTATLYFPSEGAEQLKESERPLSEHSEIAVVGKEGDATVLKIGSGKYTFSSPSKQ